MARACTTHHAARTSTRSTALTPTGRWAASTVRVAIGATVGATVGRGVGNGQSTPWRITPHDVDAHLVPANAS